MNVPSTASTTIILVAYHGDRWIPACIDSLRESARSIRLVLLDNAGNTCIDGLDLSGFDHMVLRAPRPLGFAEANNFALKQAGLGTEFVCFLNQDTISGPAWIEACVDVLRAEPEIGAVSPMIATYDEQGWDRAFLECARQSEAFRQDFDGSRLVQAYYETSVITAAAMVVRGAALLAVGPFDPIYGSYYEDFDLCRRIREAGYRVGVCTRGTVGHFAGSATTDDKSLRRRSRQITRNRVIYSVRSAGARRVPALLRYWITKLPYDLARSVWGTPSSTPLSAYLGAHLDLMRLMPRLLSASNDRKAWRRYLAELGWPDRSDDYHPDPPRTGMLAELGLGD